MNSLVMEKDSNTKNGEQDQLDPESHIKNSLIQWYNNSIKEGERVDISKTLDEYQNKFNVPKVLIMKWLGINQQKSLFNNPKFQENLSQSFISQDSEYTVSEPSPLMPNKAKQAQIKENLGKTFQRIFDKGTIKYCIFLI